MLRWLHHSASQGGITHMSSATWFRWMICLRVGEEDYINVTKKQSATYYPSLIKVTP